jgi:dUTPase
MAEITIEVQAETNCLPEKKHPDDAAFDLKCRDKFTIRPNQILNVRTGVRISIPSGYAGEIFSRSGLAASGITVLGGLIDAGYTGEIIVILHNSRSPRTFEAGTRIAQILFREVPQVNLQFVSELSTATLRGENGLGSTGIN